MIYNNNFTHASLYSEENAGLNDQKKPVEPVTPIFAEQTSPLIHHVGSNECEKTFSDLIQTDREHKDRINIELLCEALKQNDWNHSVFMEQDLYPYYASVAASKGKISQTQYFTVLSYYSARKDAQLLLRQVEKEPNTLVQSICLFNRDGSVNPQARSAIQFTLKNRENFYLSEQELEVFFEEMKKHPLSEQQFFCFSDQAYLELPNGNLIILDQKETLSKSIQKLDFNVFFHFSLDENSVFSSDLKPIPNRMRMVPSLSMCQTFLNVLYQDQAVRIDPCIGLASLDKIKADSLVRKRVMGFATPNEPLPSLAEGLSVMFDSSWLLHELYHCHTLSNIPQGHIEGFIEISDISFSQQNFSLGSFLGEALIDMDHFIYRKIGREGVYPFTDSQLFWVTLAYDYEKASHETTQYLTLQELTPFTNTIIKTILTNQNQWQTRNIYLDDLEEVTQFFAALQEMDPKKEFYPHLEITNALKNSYLKLNAI